MESSYTTDGRAIVYSERERIIFFIERFNLHYIDR